jgi:predicted Zn finger-like uncharacterized protein
MSLATRCTSCGTIFRVVQDQLKVSDGWVRCGRCNEVFNAMEGLFDLQRDAPQRARGDAPPPPGPAPARAPPRPVPRALDDSAPLPSPPSRARAAAVSVIPEEEAALGDTAVAKVMRELATHEHGAITKGPPAAVAAPSPARPPPRAPAPRPVTPWRDPEDENVSILPADDLHPAFADATFPESVVSGIEPAETLPSAIEPSQLESNQTTRPRPPSRTRSSSSSRSSSSRSSKSRSSRSRSSRSEAPAAPGFLRKAALEARWRRPWVRAVLLLTVLALNAVLAGQMAYQWRDRVAVQWPRTKPLLTAACSVLNCVLQAPRAIDAIVVESTTLTRLEGVVEGYRLTVVLRNRAPYEVQQPYLDLSLTDGDGLVVARRALTPGDFRARSTALPQQSETALQLAMVIEGHRVAGYTVAAFYP